MRRNKKLILISSILATTAIAVVPAISIVNNASTVNVIDSQLDNLIQNNEQIEVGDIDSDVDPVDANNQVKAEGEFIVDATTLEGTWGTGLSGNLVFTISDDVAKTVSIRAENYKSFSATDFSIQETITNAGEEYRITEIDRSAFGYCTGLKGTLTIPASVTSIGEIAFVICIGLTGAFTIPASVTSIGDTAFSNCRFTSIGIETGNKYFCKAENLGKNCEAIINNTTGIFDNGSRVVGSLARGQLELPSDLTSIGDNAFASCPGLKCTLTIPASVTSIGKNAFNNCPGLTGTLTIPASVTSIGGAAFAYCSGLTGILTILDGVTSIGASAFANCANITSVVIGGGVTSIGAKAFSSCTKLADVTIFATTPPAIQADSFVYSTQTLYVPAGCEGAYKSDSNWTKFNIIETIVSIALSGSQGDNEIITGTGGDIAIAAAIDGTVTGNLTWNIIDDSTQPGELPSGITIMDGTNLGCNVNVDPTVVAGVYNVILTATGTVNGASISSEPLGLTITVASIPIPPGSIALSGSQGDNEIITGTGGDIAIAAAIDGTVTGNLTWNIIDDSSQLGELPSGITIMDGTNLGCNVNVDTTVVAGVYNVILTATGTVNGASISSEPFKLTITVATAPTGSIALSGSQGDNKIITGTGGDIAIAAAIDGAVTGNLTWSIEDDSSQPGELPNGITIMDETISGCNVNVDSTVVAGVYNVILTATGTVNGASISSEPFELTITVTTAPIPPEPKPVPADDLNLAAIIGGSIGGAVGVAAIAGGITYGVKRNKAKK